MIDALGPEVDGWEVGARVGVGWFGGSCGTCGHCRRGDAFACETIHIASMNEIFRSRKRKPPMSG